MKQVDFYLISNQVDNAKYKLASKLANKLLHLKQSALLVTDNADHTAQLDNVMWSFNDTSFLAHEVIAEHADQPQAALGQILIGEHALVSRPILDSGFEVLVNLSSSVPEFNHHFARIAEVVEANEAAKAEARLRYKHYQSEGFELKTHQIEL